MRKTDKQETIKLIYCSCTTKFTFCIGKNINSPAYFNNANNINIILTVYLWYPKKVDHRALNPHTTTYKHHAVVCAIELFNKPDVTHTKPLLQYHLETQGSIIKCELVRLTHLHSVPKYSWQQGTFYNAATWLSPNHFDKAPPVTIYLLVLSN